jgi:hypothetical protein
MGAVEMCLNAPLQNEMTLKNDAKSFIVRIWIESAPEDELSPTWRGVIEHVGSEDRKHFHELDSVTQFICEKTGLAQKASVSDWWQALKTRIIDELRKLLPNLQ